MIKIRLASSLMLGLLWASSAVHAYQFNPPNYSGNFRYLDANASHCEVSSGISTQRCGEINSRQQLASCAQLGNGTLESPWCSVQQAAEFAQPGEIVLIAPGKYLTPGGTHGLSRFATNADKDNPIVFRHAEFDPQSPQIPAVPVTITPFVSTSDWQSLYEDEQTLVCEHQGISGDDTSFNGVTTNMRGIDDVMPMMRLFGEGCGVVNSPAGVDALLALDLADPVRVNSAGYYVQVWHNGDAGYVSECPASQGSGSGSTLVRVEKTAQIQSCADVSLAVTGVGHTIHLRSTGNVCGDLAQLMEVEGFSPEQIGFNDSEPDYLVFEGLTIEAAQYGMTIETDHIALRYSSIFGSYKDAVKGGGPEPWDQRAPNACARTSQINQAGSINAGFTDLVNFCQSGTAPSIGQLILPPSCDEGVIDAATLDPQYFFWQSGDELVDRLHMQQASDSTGDEYCVADDCIFEPAQSMQKYCAEVVGRHTLDSMGGTLPIPDQCNDFYYFNAQQVLIEHNDIRYFGEEGVDITGGDDWLVRGNTIHDSVITHGVGQLPSGVMSKNASWRNRIEDNLLFNVHHSENGIFSLGGAPAKANGALDLIVQNNAVVSVSGQVIVHLPGCEHCLVANNLFADMRIGEEGQRSGGFAHVGGHRKNCVTAGGDLLPCAAEKRSAAYAGDSNSMVNNLIEGIKWRDMDSFRLLSVGGYQLDEEQGYLYNGAAGLCIGGNNAVGGDSVVKEVSHVSEASLPELACSLNTGSESQGISFADERMQSCMSELTADITQTAPRSLADCLRAEEGQTAGNKIGLNAASTFAHLAISSPFEKVMQVGRCLTGGQVCTSDVQCPESACGVDMNYLDKCTLGPNTTNSDIDSSCTLASVETLFASGSVVYQNPMLSWQGKYTDKTYRVLLYRFHPDGGVNNKHWYELLDNRLTDAQSVCDENWLCGVMPPEELGVGTYTWKVRRESDYGWGDWTLTHVFYIR